MRADHADRLVVGEALVLRQDHAIHPAIGERQAQHSHRVVAGDAGGRGQRHRSCAAAGDDAPFRAGQFREPLAGGFHQFVQVDELA